ncbi:MAG: hypothetical protein R8P61_03285 [Bacteroidia bacterium]|nr:hypothetical protein [Bacteroidia bacterium]
MSFFSKIFKNKSKGAPLVLDANGLHRLGGKAPKEFTMPELESSPMIYLGFISKHDPGLELVDFDLHLVFPYSLTGKILCFSTIQAPIVQR